MLISATVCAGLIVLLSAYIFIQHFAARRQLSINPDSSGSPRMACIFSDERLILTTEHRFFGHEVADPVLLTLVCVTGLLSLLAFGMIANLLRLHIYLGLLRPRVVHLRSFVMMMNFELIVIGSLLPVLPSFTPPVFKNTTTYAFIVAERKAAEERAKMPPSHASSKCCRPVGTCLLDHVISSSLSGQDCPSACKVSKRRDNSEYV
jgi:hypothetical protein